MIENLISLIRELLTDNEIGTYDEAATSQTIVESILRTLGWNTNHRYEVYPQYPIFEKTNEKKKIDFSLRHKDTNEVFIEVKRVGEPLLEEYQGQLLRCCSEYDVRLAVLTDGLDWMFFLPMDKSGQDKFFDLICLTAPESKNSAERFIDYLYKDNVIRGKAVGKAQQMLENQRNFNSKLFEWIRQKAQEYGIEESFTIEITCLPSGEFTIDTRLEGDKSNKITGLIDEEYKRQWGETKLIDEEGKETVFNCPSSIANHYGLRIKGRRDMVNVFERPLLNEDGRPSPHTFIVDATKGQHFYVTVVSNI